MNIFYNINVLCLSDIPEFRDMIISPFPAY